MWKDHVKGRQRCLEGREEFCNVEISRYYIPGMKDNHEGEGDHCEE